MRFRFTLRKALAVGVLSTLLAPFAAFGLNANTRNGRTVPDSIVNGDFQYPSNKTVVAVNPMATFMHSYNISPDTGRTNTKIDWAGNTVTIPDFDKSKFGWRSTQTLTEPGVIEIQHRDTRDKDNLYTELCAFEKGTSIYQDVKTVEDSIYRWTLKHSALDSKNIDKMQVLIGAVGAEKVSPATRIESESGQEIGETSDTITSINRNDGTTPSPSWNTYTGAAYIPRGQSTTRFIFKSVASRTPMNGNLLDDISFSVAYPLYYNLNGGSGTVPQPADNNYSGYHACGDDVNLRIDSVPTKDGCVFLGWSTERIDTIENQSDYDANKDKIIDEVTFGDSSITVYAVYETKPFTVTFVDGLTGSVIEKQTVRKNGNASLPTAPTHTGYVVNGWDSDWKNITSDKTVTVSYSPIRYRINFNKNDANASGTMGSQSMVYDVPSNLNANAFSNRGYSFIGWSENRDGSERIYLDREEVINLVSSNNGEVTLYAQWVKNKSISITYDIKTDDNDGDGTVSVSNTLETFAEGERPSGSKANPSDAYDFIGWFDSGTLISSERFLSPGEVSEDTVYTAYFKRKEFNVRFLDNDGSVISEAKVKYGHSAIAPNPPIHDGFNFTDWDKKFDYITGDLDITAAYKPNSVLPGDKGDDGDTDNDNENTVPGTPPDASNSNNSGAKEDNVNISGNANVDNIDTSAGMGNAATAENILNELIQTGVNIGYLPLIAFLLSIGVFYGIHRKKHRN